MLFNPNIAVEISSGIIYCIYCLIANSWVYGIPQQVFAHATTASSSSGAARLLVDDVIQDLKTNESKKASVHLSILNQQLATLGNSSLVQFAKSMEP